MEYPLYFILSVIALFLNLGNRGNLQLFFLVILTFYFPTENIRSYYTWYGVVIGFDVLMCIISFFSRSLASKAVFGISLLLVACHVMAFITKQNNYYFFIAQYLEHLQIVCFILCAPVPILYTKRKVKKWIKRFGYGF